MEWHVWDFPDNVRIYFDEEFRIELFRMLKGNESRNKLAKKFGVNTSTIKSYFQNGVDSQGLKTYIPVGIIKKIPQILDIGIDSEFMLNLEKNIVAYRARNGRPVMDPKLPIKETPHLYSIVAHLICDGTAGKRKTPCYYNICRELLDEFKKNLQVFGKVKTTEYIICSNVYAVMFPKAIGDILSHIFQVRFIRTPNLPALFFQAPKNCQYAAIRAMFDDEGSVSKKGQISFTQKEIGIILDLKKLLNENEFKTGTIYTDKRGCNRIAIISVSYTKFIENIGFTHPTKKMRLMINVENQHKRNIIMPSNEKIYSEILNQKTLLTNREIAKHLGIKLSYTRNVLTELKNKGKIKSHYNGVNKPYLWGHA